MGRFTFLHQGTTESIKLIDKSFTMNLEVDISQVQETLMIIHTHTKDKESHKLYSMTKSQIKEDKYIRIHWKNCKIVCSWQNKNTNQRKLQRIEFKLFRIWHQWSFINWKTIQIYFITKDTVSLLKIWIALQFWLSYQYLF